MSGRIDPQVEFARWPSSDPGSSRPSYTLSPGRGTSPLRTDPSKPDNCRSLRVWPMVGPVLRLLFFSASGRPLTHMHNSRDFSGLNLGIELLVLPRSPTVLLPIVKVVSLTRSSQRSQTLQNDSRPTFSWSEYCVLILRPARSKNLQGKDMVHTLRLRPHWHV